MRPERKSAARNPALYLLCALLWVLICVGYIADAVKMHNHSAARMLTIVGTAFCAVIFGWLWSKTRITK